MRGRKKGKKEKGKREKGEGRREYLLGDKYLIRPSKKTNRGLQPRPAPDELKQIRTVTQAFLARRG